MRAQSLRSRLIVDPEAESTLRSTAPAFASLSTELEFGAVWTRPDLSLADRMVVVLSCLTREGYDRRLRAMIPGAIELGLSVANIVEIIVQSGLYNGIVSTERALLAVSDQLGEQPELATDATFETAAEDHERRRGAAQEFRRHLHGDRRNDGHADPNERFTAAAYELASTFGYGAVWRRPGLTLRQRVICAVASFVSTGHIDVFFVKFARSALAHGFTIEEVTEVTVQTIPYVGFPKALSALGALKSVVEPDAADESNVDGPSMDDNDGAV